MYFVVFAFDFITHSIAILYAAMIEGQSTTGSALEISSLVRVDETTRRGILFRHMIIIGSIGLRRALIRERFFVARGPTTSNTAYFISFFQRRFRTDYFDLFDRGSQGTKNAKLISSHTPSLLRPSA